MAWQLLIRRNFFRTCTSNLFFPLCGVLIIRRQVGQRQPGQPARLARPPTKAKHSQTHTASRGIRGPCPTLSYVAVKAPPLLFILFLGSPSLDFALRPALIRRTEHKGPSVAPSSRRMPRLKPSRRPPTSYLVTVLASALRETRERKIYCSLSAHLLFVCR